MKSNLLLTLLGAALIASVPGCETGPSIAYDPSLKSAISAENKVAVTAISARPAKPVAHQSWKAVMKVRNLSQVTLKDVSYEFLYDGGGKILGRGKIPQISPGQVVEVASDPADKLEQGSYRIEGRVFLGNGAETVFSDRMDNWKDVNVMVAQ
jgi:hypothetical protein